MKKLLLAIGLFSISVAAKAGPIGPPSGYPYDPTTVILSTPTRQTGKTFNVSSATVAGLNTSTITASRIVIAGVVVSTSITSGTSVYPATGTIIAAKGINATTMTITGILNGTAVTITGLFTGATIHGSSAVITGTITGSNLTGTNTGDVTIGTGRGLSISGQVVSLAAASAVSTGSLNAQDFNTFNNKLDPSGDGSALTGMTKDQVGLDNVANVDQQDATNITSGTVGTARLGSGTASSARYLRGDSSWQLLNSTAAGLGNVTNDKQVKVADYTQQGAILVGLSPGIFSVLAPGNNTQILSADSSQSTGYKWITSPTSFTIYPASSTAILDHGIHASTLTLTGTVSGVDATFRNVTTTGLLTGTTLYFSSGSFSGQVTGANLSGNNSGDVSLGSSTNGLMIVGQILSLSTSGPTSVGSLTATDWNAFNNKNATFTVSAPIQYSAGVISIDKSSATLLGPAPTTSSIPEGSHLYYTTARATSAISATDPISNTNGVIAIDKSSVTLLGPTPTTTVISEGSNLYYTTARTTTAVSGQAPISNVNGEIRIDKSSATLLGPSPTTSVISEGSNLYYTVARTTTAITATSPLSNTNGVVSIATATATSTGALKSTDWSTFNNKTSTSGATVTDFTITSGTVTASSATVAAFASSSATVRHSLYLGVPGLAGKPDSPLFIYNDTTDFSSRPGIGIDVVNNSASRIPIAVFTNRSTPALNIGTAMFFYQQLLDGTDVQQGGIAFSQNSSTNTDKMEIYLGAGGSSGRNSLPVLQTLGSPTTGYAFTMFGPTGAEYASNYPYGAYTPAAMAHVASDFGDDSDGIRIERRRTPNAARYNIRVLPDGGLGMNLTSSATEFEMTATSVTISTPTVFIGRNDGSTPPAGYHGEQIKETDGNDRGVISGAFVTHSTDVVTAGSWMCSGYIELNGNGVAWSAASAALSLFPNNTVTDHVTGYNVVNYNPSSPGVNDVVGLVIPQFIVNVNTSTNVYIKYKVTTAGAVKFRDSGISCTRL